MEAGIKQEKKALWSAKTYQNFLKQKLTALAGVANWLGIALQTKGLWVPSLVGACTKGNQSIPLSQINVFLLSSCLPLSLNPLFLSKNNEKKKSPWMKIKKLIHFICRNELTGNKFIPHRVLSGGEGISIIMWQLPKWWESRLMKTTDGLGKQRSVVVSNNPNVMLLNCKENKK